MTSLEFLLFATPLMSQIELNGHLLYVLSRLWLAGYFSEVDGT
jgi:hypothetical protein